MNTEFSSSDIQGKSKNCECYECAHIGHKNCGCCSIRYHSYNYEPEI